MGLTTWRGDAVRKHDVTIAKNDLSAAETRALNRIVTMWLDFADDQARRRKQVFFKDWETKLKEFLVFNERAVLSGAGSISKDDADARIESASNLFRGQEICRREFTLSRDFGRGQAALGGASRCLLFFCLSKRR
jgi:hypothetical protein